MAVKLRLSRYGAKKNPFYRVVAIESKTRRDGRCVEHLGYYNPKTDPAQINLKMDRVSYWLEAGAQASETVASLIDKARKQG